MKVAVFPFENITLFPQTNIPLFVYDEHYISMIEYCIENDTQMAIGLGDPVTRFENGVGQTMLRPRHVMSLARPEILKRFHDGSIYVQMNGLSLIKLDKVLSQKPFLICEAKDVKYEDVVLEPKLILDASKNYLNRLKKWIDKNIASEQQRCLIMNQIDTPEKVINYTCCLAVEDREARQLLLESLSLREKIEALNALFLHAPLNTPFSANPLHTQRMGDFNNLEGRLPVVH